MKRIFLFFLFNITIISSSMAKEITINEKEGCYSIKGKYHTYIKENKDFLELLANYKEVLNTKDDFVDTVPDFVFMEIETSFTHDNINSADIKYYVFDKKSDCLKKQKVRYNIKIKEWIAFKSFLEELENKEIFITTEIKEYMKKNNIPSLSDFRLFQENIERKEVAELEDIRAKKSKENILEELKEYKKDNYTFKDLLDYLLHMPEAVLPYPDKEVIAIAGCLFIESENLDGNGIDYLVSYNGEAGLIYVYGENIKTRPTRFLNSQGFFITGITFQNDITLRYTGMTAPAISRYGNRIEVPIFIAK